MKETFISIKIVPLAYTHFSNFPWSKRNFRDTFALKFFFWYDLKLSSRISFSALHSLKTYFWVEFSVQETRKNCTELGLVIIESVALTLSKARKKIFKRISIVDKQVSKVLIKNIENAGQNVPNIVIDWARHCFDV